MYKSKLNIVKIDTCCKQIISVELVAKICHSVNNAAPSNVANCPSATPLLITNKILT